MTNRIINLVAFVVPALLWLAFFFALIFNRDLLIPAWQTLRGWPIVVQLVVWLLLLPLTLGLWIWQTSWPLVLRLILVIGLGAATIYMFFPKKTGDQGETSQAKP